MHRKSGRQIGQAIETCLDLFYVTRHPLSSLAKTLDTLRRIGWCEDDIGRVERIARKALNLPFGSRPHEKAA